MRLVEQTKLLSMYAREARRGNFECSVTDEDISDSFKKALIALQSKERRSYGLAKNFDHISQVLQIGKVSNAIVQENTPLIKETLSVITDEILP